MPKILVVDDNQGIADVLEQYLGAKGRKRGVSPRNSKLIDKEEGKG